MRGDRRLLCHRRHLGAVVALALLAAAGCRRERPAPPPANLVFVTIDALRADHVGVDGYRLGTTPSLDRLARSGAVFTQAIAQAPWTRASMGSVMTGLHPTSIGLTCHDFRVPKADCDILQSGLTTMAELFHDAGFDTASVVANINVDPLFGFDQGFDRVFVVPRSLEPLGVAGRLANDWMEATTQEVTNTAIAWLEEHRRSGGGRLLLNLHYLDPHDPYRPPARDEARFAGADYSQIAPPSRDAIARYDGEIHFVDREFTRILVWLQEHGHGADTGIVVISDHGEEFHDHGRTFHGHSVFDELIRVPLLVVLPGWSPAGTVVDQQVRLVDVLPTLIEVYGLTPRSDLEGQSLMPLLRGEVLPELPALSERGYRPFVSWRSPPYKLICDTEQKTLALFRLDRDPHETRDLSAVERDVAHHLLGEMLAARATYAEKASHLKRDAHEVRLTTEQAERLRSLGYVQ